MLAGCDPKDGSCLESPSPALAGCDPKDGSCPESRSPAEAGVWLLDWT